MRRSREPGWGEGRRCCSITSAGQDEDDEDAAMGADRREQQRAKLRIVVSTSDVRGASDSTDPPTSSDWTPAPLRVQRRTCPQVTAAGPLSGPPAATGVVLPHLLLPGMNNNDVCVWKCVQKNQNKTQILKKQRSAVRRAPIGQVCPDLGGRGCVRHPGWRSSGKD